MALRIGDTAVDKVFVGGDAVSKIFVGSDEVWSAVTPLGMEKQGTVLIANSSSTWTTIAPWRARASFESTQLTDSGMQVPAGTYDIYIRLDFSSTSVASRRLRVMVGSTIVVPSTASSAAPLIHSARITIPAGELLVQANASTSTTAYRTVVDGSYVTLIPVS